MVKSMYHYCNFCFFIWLAITIIIIHVLYVCSAGMLFGSLDLYQKQLWPQTLATLALLVPFPLFITLYLWQWFSVLYSVCKCLFEIINLTSSTYDGSLPNILKVRIKWFHKHCIIIIVLCLNPFFNPLLSNQFPLQSLVMVFIS